MPDAPYELPESNGLRPNVVFPGGLIAEADGTCKIYWGAADTTVAMGTAKTNRLLFKQPINKPLRLELHEIFIGLPDTQEQDWLSCCI